MVAELDADLEATVVAPAGDGSVADRPDARREVFADAYRRLWPDALRLARLLTGSTPVAEDVAQDAFVGVHRRWRVVDNPDGYIRTAVVNAVRTHGRRHARRGADLELDEADGRPTGIPEIDETWELLRHLGERQRTAIVLRYCVDLPLADVAMSLGCPVGTAKSTRGGARRPARSCDHW